jgi:hypothetical protein
MDDQANNALHGVLRIRHEKSGRRSRVTGCEVLVDGEVVAELPASSYTLSCEDPHGPLRLTVTLPVVEDIGDIVAWAPRNAP